jgi:hypothetical protein
MPEGRVLIQPSFFGTFVAMLFVKGSRGASDATLKCYHTKTSFAAKGVFFAVKVASFLEVVATISAKLTVNGCFATLRCGCTEVLTSGLSENKKFRKQINIKFPFAYSGGG